MEKFFNLIYRLRFVKRWATSFNDRQESVAEHSFSVAVIAHLLSLINNEINESFVNAETVAVESLYHDSFECYTSHIVSPIKNSTPGFKKSYEELKDSYSIRLFSSLPGILKNKIEDPKNIKDEKIIEIMNAADAIDAYLYCKFQVKVGNNDYKNKLQLMEEKIQKAKKKHNYVNWFFENLCDFEDLEINY